MELPGFGVESVPAVNALLNVGAGLDIPSGSYRVGRYGEHILLAGMTPLVGVTGVGNTFKTELLEFMQRQMLRRFPGSRTLPYDTEANKNLMRFHELYSRHPEWDGENVLDSGRCLVSSAVQHLGCEFYDKIKDYLQENKIDPKNRKKYLVNTPFLDADGKSFLQMPLPTGGTIDSLTSFRTKDIAKMADDHDISSEKGNPIWLRQGARKKRLLEELPVLCTAAGHYIGLTAHLGDTVKLDPYAPVLIQLQHLKNGDMKGVPRDFTYLTHSLYHIYSSTVLTNQGTKAPEFPRDSFENEAVGSTDLNIIRLRMLRSKVGPSGFILDILVSQEEGILDYLTEFYYVKTRKGYGIGGHDRSYHLELRPEVNMSRTTVRGKLAEDARLRRAMNITSELCQIGEYHPGSSAYMMTPGELFQRINELGYNWDQLLDTRSWWTYDNDKHPIPFLSTRDLLEMAHKRYVPYWMTDVPEAVKDVPRKKAF